LGAGEQGNQEIKSMRALWLENQNLEFKSNLPLPHPAESETLIRVSMAGVCSTDLELVRGYYPFTGIPGHEFVGEVVSSPADHSWVGKRVVGEINIACGECETCRAGLTRHCERRRTLGIHDWDGAFAEYLVLPLTNLHIVPDQIPDKLAVFTEPLAAALEILEQNQITPEDRVLVIGAGRLGQLVAQVLQGTGCKLDVVARHSKQRDLLAKRNIHSMTDQKLGDKKYDVVIEATGSADGFLLARKCIRPRGKIILKSTYKGDLMVNFSAIVVDEVTLMGSRCGPFEPALKLLAEGKVDPMSLIEVVYPLEQGMSAFEQAAMPGVLKVLIQL
jgi:2-desacetyl-2-hydroxyethyl bacteriochlorophyllide A dehydrogenase